MEPIIDFKNDEEFIRFMTELQKMRDSSKTREEKAKFAYFIVTNPQFFPSELAEHRKIDYIFPLNAHNVKILYSFKNRMYNCEEPFVEWMERFLGTDICSKIELI